MFIDLLVLMLNSMVTFSCALCIFLFIYSKRIERHPFYYFWLSGFVVYALEILLRGFIEVNFLTYAMLIGSYFFFSIGLWSITRQKSILVLLAGLYVAVLLLFIVWTASLVPYDMGVVFGVPLVYGGVTSFVFYNRVKFGRAADKFTLGWLLLFITNLFLFDKGWVTDIFAIISKLILLAGIIDHDFIILTQKIRREFHPHFLPLDAEWKKEGTFKLVLHSAGSANPNKTRWVERKVEENVKGGYDTYLFVFQDVVSYRELQRIKWISPETVFVFIFSASAKKAKEEFTVLPMGLTQIGATLSEVTKRYEGSEKGCTVIFLDLSLLTHLFGVHPVYNMLLNKMGSLREGGIDLFAFFHPDTHSDESVVPLFSSISDEVIKQ